jgi:hypothetical protein
LNPGFPAWRAGVLVQARRPPLLLLFYWFWFISFYVCGFIGDEKRVL